MKCKEEYEKIKTAIVALFTRAWIEISAEKNRIDKTSVALFTRAWIEITFSEQTINVGDKSPSSRGRGLKFP